MGEPPLNGAFQEIVDDALAFDVPLTDTGELGTVEGVAVALAELLLPEALIATTEKM